jgi:sodium/potassium-transporting ATPase subunit alpha
MSDGVDAKMPFNSQYKFALIIIEEPTQNSHYSILMKGAPEKILKYCTNIMENGNSISLTENHKDEFAKANTIFGRGGQRVLGFTKL